jgi:hypothetical protein
MMSQRLRKREIKPKDKSQKRKLMKIPIRRLRKKAKRRLLRNLSRTDLRIIRRGKVRLRVRRTYDWT